MNRAPGPKVLRWLEFIYVCNSDLCITLHIQLVSYQVILPISALLYPENIYNPKENVKYTKLANIFKILEEMTK